MSDEILSPQQLIVINALTEGVNMTDAAAQAGVHRNTIANWRRNSLFFRESLADAQYDRALLFREKMEDRLNRAFETLDSILNDPKASPATRLKAALFIIGKATTPPVAKKHVPFVIDEIPASHQTMHNVHNQAQAAPATGRPTPENPPTVHNRAQNAQVPYRRETPKVGRNQACPCGSGRKYKQCCLNKPAGTEAMAA